jgi:cell division septal protein FtsQ
MSLFGFLKKRKNNTRLNRKNAVQSRTGSVYSSKQTKESEILLRKINKRKRKNINSRVIFRKKSGVFKKLGILIILLGVLSYLVYRFDLLNYFNISFVNVSGAEYFVSSEDVKAIVERNSIGQSIFTIDEEKIADVLKKSFLGAKTIIVNRKFPNSLEIIIEERIPLAIAYNDRTENFLIDSEGYVLGAVEDDFFDLPKIKYEGSIVIGTFLDKDIVPLSIEILQFAEKEELKISSMSFYPKHVKIFVGNNVEVFIGYDKANEKSLRTIEALLKSPQEENKMLKKIDLRYDKVIVLYE